MKKINIFLFIMLGLLCGCEFNKVNFNEKLNFNKQSEIGNTQGNLINSGMVTYDSNNLYYIEPKTSVISKLSSDGTKAVLSQECGWYLNLVGDTLYYVNAYNNSICSVNINGENKSVIYDEGTVNYMYIYNNIIYMITLDESKKAYLCSMDLSGGNIKILAEGEKISQMYIYNGFIYYLVHGDSSMINKISLDGTEFEQIIPDFDYYIYWFIVYNDDIYFREESDNANLKKFDIINGTVSDVINDMENVVIHPESYNFVGNKVIFKDVQSRYIHFINLDNNELHKGEKINFSDNVNFELLYILDDKIFLYENLNAYLMNSDGSNKQKIE